MQDPIAMVQVKMAPRERFELPRRRPPVVRSEISFFRDHRLTGLDYLGVTDGETSDGYKHFVDRGDCSPYAGARNRGCRSMGDVLVTGREKKKSPRDMVSIMHITVIQGREEQAIDVQEGSTPLDIIRQLALAPDAFLVLRERSPIPVDEVLTDGDSIRLIRVASGG
jgi:sulfur carrier protein ThiS